MCTGVVWDVTSSMWDVASSMWAITSSMWAVTSSMHDALALCGLLHPLTLTITIKRCNVGPEALTLLH